jgi:hypothetical protein
MELSELDAIKERIRNGLSDCKLGFSSMDERTSTGGEKTLVVTGPLKQPIESDGMMEPFERNGIWKNQYIFTFLPNGG